MALSGACPGTVFVQLAQGISSANSTALGALLGGGTYVRLLHLIKKQPPQKGTKAAALSKQTISDELEISEVVTYVILGAAVMAILCLTEAGAGSFPTSPTAGGLLIGLAQGVVAGSTALLKQGTFPDVSAKGLHIPAWQAFVGGFVMAFGARLGRGCTSGHGLSGLSAMSFSSLITMTAMFGARIVTRLSMKALNVQ